MAKQNEITNAFEEVASTSSSTLKKKAAYDVFINHRGIDVKKTLASSIYHTLDLMGIRVFLDEEELELGDVIPVQIQDVMRRSVLHIAIFSPNYAQSPWCLAELSFILKTDTRIIPVFYNVDPNDLRWPSKGMYAEAFSQHEAKNRYTPEKLEDWKMALQEVSYRSGYILKNNDDEGRLLKSIVNCVLKDLKTVQRLDVAKYPVGLDETVRDFEKNAFDQSSSQKVQIVGIVGMGGSGKTTLAKELYNQKCSSFDASSFIFEVRDAAAKKDLYKKQKKLIEDLHVKNLSFDNVEEGKRILASRLRSLCLFIILDDVDHRDQLDALLPGIDSLASGSLIIVTSREMGVLKSWGISSIYKMKELNPHHSTQLLCWHAFLQPSPREGFEGLVEGFVDVCNGLPLSLKVFGAQLYGKVKEYWESQLDKISRLLPKDIKETLQVSYDALDEEEKEMFLDVACFFIGEYKSLAISVWDGCGWSGVHSWETLLNKCLVELDEKNCIKMHDQLRDLGKEIAMRQSPYRLWLPEQITNIQKQAKERVLIRGIKADTTEFHEDSTASCSSHYETLLRECMELVGSSCRPSSLNGLELLVTENYSTRKSEATEERVLVPGIKAENAVFHKDSSHYQTPFQQCMELVRNSSRKFKHSGQLKLLVVRENYLREEFATVSTGLVWLRWVDFEQRTLPSWLSLKNFSVLEILNATELEQLWRDNDDPPLELRELTITGGWSFLSFPTSIGCLKRLKKIVFHANHGCVSRTPTPMSCLPEEFCLLQSLEHLALEKCAGLRSLPSRFGELANLRHLNLSGCDQLMTLPVSFKQLIHLEYINLAYCSRLTLASENADILENMTKLEMLCLSGCWELQELPFLTNQRRSLRELDLWPVSLSELPSNIGELSKLEVLNIGSRLFTSLPTSLGNLSSLTCLEILHCEKLESLPDSLGNLSSLTSLSIDVCRMLESLPDSLGSLTSLTRLRIFDCSIKSLPESTGNLSSLTSLSIDVCRMLESLPESIGGLNLLQNLQISGTGIKSLPKAVVQLSNLQRLCIGHSPIKELDFESGSFSSLLWMDLSGIDVSRICISQQCCPCLEILELAYNKQLIDIQKLPISLKEVTLQRCEMLKSISGICGLLNLKKLVIEECGKLDELPSFAELVSLETLRVVETTWRVAAVQSWEHMERLRRLELIHCNISAIEPCLKTLKKWPSERIVCERPDDDVDSCLHGSSTSLKRGERSFINAAVVPIAANYQYWISLEPGIELPNPSKL